MDNGNSKIEWYEEKVPGFSKEIKRAWRRQYKCYSHTILKYIEILGFAPDP